MPARPPEDRERLNQDGLAEPDAQADYAATPPANLGGEFGDVEAKRQVIAAQRARAEAPEQAADSLTRIARGGEAPNAAEVRANAPVDRPS